MKVRCVYSTLSVSNFEKIPFSLRAAIATIISIFILGLFLNWFPAGIGGIFFILMFLEVPISIYLFGPEIHKLSIKAMTKIISFSNKRRIYILVSALVLAGLSIFGICLSAKGPHEMTLLLQGSVLLVMASFTILAFVIESFEHMKHAKH
jgi:hypothetical protein